MTTKTVTAYYCENGSFGNCDENCTYNEADPKDAGAYGKVFFCNNSNLNNPPLYVLKEDTKHDRTKPPGGTNLTEEGSENIEESLALQGEFNFIDWSKEQKYKNVAKMHRVKCTYATEEEQTKCETKEDKQLDKTKVVIERINPLKEYMKNSIEKNCATKAVDVCKKEGKDYDDVLNKLQIYFKRNLIRKLVKAIDELHKLSYCHNDLKPGNIGVSGKHEIKFIDMGSATLIKEGTLLKEGVVEAKALEHKTDMEALYKPSATGYYLMRDTDLNKGGTFEYIPPMFSTSLGSLTHDKHRDKWSVGCIIYDIIKYNPDNSDNVLTLFHHKYDPLLIGLEHLKMNKEELNNKLDNNEVFSADEKTQFKYEIDQMKELMKSSLHEKYTLKTDEAKVFEATYGITDFDKLKTAMDEENRQKLEEKKNKLEEKKKTEEHKPEEVEHVNEPCVKLKKPSIYAQESSSAQAPQKKGRFTVCDADADEPTDGGCKKRGGGSTVGQNIKIVPGVETDETGEYIYITNPTAYREYLLEKGKKPQPQPQGQGGGKKKHNTGKLITKERYDKEKRKLSRNVSHVRKYNTSKGFVYYLFKKS